jgi:hypothetical protein
MTKEAHATQAREIPLEKFREEWQRQLVADRTISLTALKVALAICWHMNRRKGGWAWPGISKLDKLTGLHRTTVMRAIKWLEDSGYLRVLRGHAGKQKAVNRYLPLLRSNVTESDYPSRSQSDYPSRTIEQLKPLNEPPKEPPIQSTPYSAAANAAAAASTAREIEIEEEKQPTRVPARDGPKRGVAARCYELVRQNPYGRPGDAALVSRALRFFSEEEVLEYIKQAIDTGDNLGNALWVPGE